MVRISLRQKLPYLLLIIVLMVASNIATFFYAIQLINGQTPESCERMRILNLGHFLSNPYTSIQNIKRSDTLSQVPSNKSTEPSNTTVPLIIPKTDENISKSNKDAVKVGRVDDDASKVLVNEPIEDITVKIPNEEEEGKGGEEKEVNKDSSTPSSAVTIDSGISSCKCQKSIGTVHEQKNSESCKCPSSNAPGNLVSHEVRDSLDNSKGELVDADLMMEKTIFVITPTYQRATQKVDLNSMCHTLSLVPNLIWIIVEDSQKPTTIVSRLIQRCDKVKTVHLVVPTSSIYKVKKGDKVKFKPRGVEQRNAGLNWIRHHNNVQNCSGVVYFGDDDNKYDLRLFQDIRATRKVSVWKVAWAGGLRWEGPICKNGRLGSWHSAFRSRDFMIDMAGFAVDLCHLLKHPNAKVGVRTNGHNSGNGCLETDFLEHVATPTTVDCSGSESEVYVWHSHTSKPSLHAENKFHSKGVET